jgi:hypothetical protein
LQTKDPAQSANKFKEAISAAKNLIASVGGSRSNQEPTG